ncbi:MAG: 3-dehydroquinate synthase II [Chitinophagales bacterium]
MGYEGSNRPASGREIWFDGRNVPLDRQNTWELINNSALQSLLVTAAQRREGRFPTKSRLITEVTTEEDARGLAEGETVASGDCALLATLRANGFRTCLLLKIDSKEALEAAWQAASEHDYAAVEFDLPTNIPLELILARLPGRRTRVLKRETTAEGVEVAFGVMEQGSDGVLLATEDPTELGRISRLLLRQETGRIQLQPVGITAVRHVGMGVRACVDTTGLMGRDEGMLVGSTSNGGILVCSETHYLPYMNLRPFRVNAGAVHSYIWQPQGRAEYLTDLAAGSKVLSVSWQGETRPLTVGRVKLEVRPLLLIQGEAAGVPVNVIVQDDWHIRLMGVGGEPRNATEVRPGEELLGYLCPAGRHVGLPVEETIVER